MSSNVEHIADPVAAEAGVVPQPSAPAAHSQSPLATFVRDHPLLVLAGGVAAGVVLGGLIPRKTKKALARRTSALSEIVAATAVSLGHDAAQRASSAGTQLRKGSHVLADHAEDWTAIALRGASAFAQSAAENIGKLSEVAADRAEKLGDAAADGFGKARDEAAKRLDKTVPATEAAAAQAGKRLGSAVADLRARIIG